MRTLELNGDWQIRWCDGQRGGMPHIVKEDMSLHNLYADLRGLKKEIADRYDPVKWIPATVPGEVHLDLLRAGLIDSPYNDTGVLKCRWVEECIWYYRRVFDARELADQPHAYLRFACLDYGAVVYLNGQEIGRHDNAFYPLLVDVSGKLKSRGNELLVRLDSGLYAVAEKPVSALHHATLSMDNLLTKRQWLRKTQSSFEWDWSPRLINVGISGDVSLYAGDDRIVEQCAVRTQTSPDRRSAWLEARLFSVGESLGDDPYTLLVTVDGQERRFAVYPDEAGCFTGRVTVDDPRLWYPAGMGEPYLYRVEVALLHGGRTLYTKTVRTGFRTVEVDQSPHPVEGNYFNFIINGRRIFIKGANFVPADMIPAAIDRARYDRLTDLALEANFNFLRVWGGGLYEADDFYELCDQKGILVWQEFISACATLPCEDAAFVESVRREAVYNLRRLSGHPSLIAWCGNNEVDVDNLESFLGRRLPDRVLYNELFPRLVRDEDPEKYYQPASPYSFDGSHTLNEKVGDQHPWEVGFSNKDHRLYRALECRFPNEGGVLGPTSLPTTLQCLPEGQRYLHSFAWDVHDNMLENWQPGSSGDENVRFWLGLDVRTLSLLQAVFASGYVQGLGLTEYADSFRSKAFTCGSAVFWMYNDCWPCTRSWTIVDYNLNRTPAYYAVKRAFAPIRAIPRTLGGEGTVYCANDTDSPAAGMVTYGVCAADGSVLLRETRPFAAPARATTAVAAVPPPVMERLGKGMLFAVLTDARGKVLSQNQTFDVTVDELGLEPASIEVGLEGGAAVFTSEKPVLGVCLDLDGGDGLADNLFDLLPGVPYAVPWPSQNPPEILYTVNDLLTKE